MSEPEANAIEVRHNFGMNRFEVMMDEKLSVVDYVRHDREIVMTHTFVPPELRGRGIAEKLVRAALDFVATERLKVVPACSYVARFITLHPEYRPLLD